MALFLKIQAVLKAINRVFFGFLSRVFFAKHILVILDGRIIAFDTAIAASLYNLRNSWLTKVMLAISKFGQEYLYGITILLCIVLFAANKSDQMLLFITTFLSGALGAAIIKRIILRPRPTASPLVIHSTYSFPSGHSMTAFVFYTLCGYLLVANTEMVLLQIVGLFLCYALILSVGISRVYLGVHHPTDVIAGYFFGAIIALGMLSVYSFIL